MKNIKPFFATTFIVLTNIAHAQTVVPNATPTVALTPSPAIASAAENPYGLAAVWGQGDWVAKSTLLLLIIMSLASWYVLISKLLEQEKLRKMAVEAEDAFAKASSLPQAASALEVTSPYRFIVESSLDAVQQHPTVARQVDLNTWAAQNIERSVATIQGNSQQGLAVLATVGSTAPFVGLFGTVWGIYNALVKIGASGQASIDKVAGPVGEALIMTALGLAVAVPAVLGYNWLVRRNKLGMDGIRAFGSNLHTNLLQQADKPQTTQTK